MNTILMNTISLDDKVIIKGGNSGGGNTPGGGNSGGGGGDTPSGGGGASAGAVNFRDYDGTILHSYSKDEFLALSELPTLPTQKGLICQGWNWDIENAQSYVSDYGVLEVGANYITDDGKTRFYIKVEGERKNFPIKLSIDKANSLVIDWGDGATESISGSGSQNVSHTYDAVGDYVISFDVAEGAKLSFVGSSSEASISKPYSIMLRKVEIGERASIGRQAFYGCYSLSSVVIPNSVTSISSQAFYGCYSLSSVVIPNGVTSIYGFSSCYSLSSIVIPNSVTSIYELSHCYSLTSVVLPNSVTSIGGSAFNSCYSLFSVVIPSSVKSIGMQAFYSCSSLCVLDFRNHTSVPTLSDDDAFALIASDCKIVVPYDLYDSWIAATNWSSLKAKIVSEYTPTECTSLTISSDDVNCYATSTIIRYEAVTNGIDLNGNILNDVVLNGTSKSEEFPMNTSEEEVLRTVSFTYLGKTATTTFKQGKFEPYTVDLNNQWRLSDLENPDASLYEGVYESYSNHNVNSGVATMYLDFAGYTEFTMYIRSDAEVGYDYMIVSQPDKDIKGSSSISDTSIVKAHTKNKASSGTAITDYEEVKYENLDGGHHRITILYYKDGGANEGTDRGYVLIKKQ